MGSHLSPIRESTCFYVDWDNSELNPLLRRLYDAFTQVFIRLHVHPSSYRFGSGPHDEFLRIPCQRCYDYIVSVLDIILNRPGASSFHGTDGLSGSTMKR